MTITIDSMLEARLRARAEAEGLTIAAYIERLVRTDRGWVRLLGRKASPAE